METISHLFSFLRPRPIDPSARAEEDARKNDLIEALARGIVARRLESPALLFLELNRPMGFLYSQAALFFRPFLALFVSMSQVDAAAEVLADRDAFDRLLDRIAELSAPPAEESS